MNNGELEEKLAAAFPISSTHPVPDVLDVLGRKPKYPFRDMKLGDSFFVPESKIDPRQAASQHKKRNPEFNYTSKRLKEGGVWGTRIWRIKAEC